MVLPDLVEREKVSETGKIEELKGKMGSQPEEGLPHSVIEAEEEINEGKLVNDAMNNGINSFVPDMMFEQMVNDFKTAKNIFGESIFRQITGYNPEYIEKNISVPEFRREIRERIKQNLENLKDKGILTKDFAITEKGFDAGALVMYIEELDNIIPQGLFGSRVHKKKSHYGEHEDVKIFNKHDRYRDIALKHSLKTALRRGHQQLRIEDLKSFERQSRGQLEIIYGLDASGSMKGKKIGVAKKAGVALAYKAMQNKDNVGLIIFGEEIKESVAPCQDFHAILKQITKIKPAKETDLVSVIKEAINLFSRKKSTKHLILITDALPTIGTKEEVMDVSGVAKEAGITISIVGIKLDKEGAELAKKITELSEGRLYVVSELENIDKLILQDYYDLR